MSLFKTFKTDSAKEVEGVDIPFNEAENADGTIPTFRISRMSSTNKKYSKALEQATRPYRRQMQLGTMRNEAAEDVMLQVFVDTVLLGWKNVRNEHDVPIEYNRGNAIKLMDTLPDLYARLQEEAQLISNFRDESLEEEAKN